MVVVPPALFGYLADQSIRKDFPVTNFKGDAEMKTTFMKSAVLSLLVIFLSTVSLMPAAQAGVIGTQSLLSSQSSTVQDQLRAALEREDVRAQLIALGVDPDKAGARVATLTPDEIAKLQNRIADLPAGAGALEVIGIVFLILLILELVGVTNIFHKI